MSTYSMIEENSIYDVRIKSVKLTDKELADPAMQPLHRSYFKMLMHPSMSYASNRADCFAAAYAAATKHMVDSLPCDLLEMCRGLDRLVTSNMTACAAAVRKMGRVVKKWNMAHPKTVKRVKEDDLFIGEELSFDELFTGETHVSTEADFDGLFN